MEYIEREAAFNAVLKLIPKVDDDGYCWVIRGDAATAIDNIPAADVRPVVKAQWEDETGFIFSDLSQQVRCSKCGLIAYFYDKMPMNFCPNCGAMMEES